MGHSREEGLTCPSVVWDGSELDWSKPREGRVFLRGVGLDYLKHEAFEEGYRRLIEEYKPPGRFKLGLFMPCSYGKPYSQSYIHYLMRSAIAPWLRAGMVHEIILTNAGVVPRELDEYWPYTAYDWNPAMETPEVRECYRRVLAERIEGYLTRFSSYYKAFAAYLRWDSDSWAALARASSRAGVDVVNLAPRTVPSSEVEEAGLGLGYEQDPDIVLVTRTGLDALRRGVAELAGPPAP